MERFQQVLEDHLSRTMSLLWSLVRDAGGLFAQPGDAAKHALSLVCPQLSAQHIHPTPGCRWPRAGKGSILAFFLIIYTSI